MYANLSMYFDLVLFLVFFVHGALPYKYVVEFSLHSLFLSDILIYNYNLLVTLTC